MTAEEIDILEAGPELDALVAEKVMGWKIHPQNTGHWMPAEDDDIDYRLMGYVIDWHPSKSIANAWTVVEKLYALGYEVCLNFTHDGHFRNGCSIREQNARSDEVVAIVISDSMTLSISRAALLTTVKR